MSITEALPCIEFNPETAPCSKPSVNELIEAYHEKGRPRFAQLRHAFEDHHGEIIEYYFARDANAGALLVKNPHKHWYRRSGYRIAVAYDSSRSVPALDEALRTAQREERQSAILLPGRAGRILAQTAYLLIVYLLSTIDWLQQHSPDAGTGKLISPDNNAIRHIKSVCASAQRDLRKMEQFTRRSARRAALQCYLMGLPMGAAIGILLVICTFKSQIIGKIDDNSSTIAFCLAAGAIGAVISVMVRITRGTTLDVDYDRGRVVTALAGSFRPVIGAVFGGALYVLVQAGLLPLHVPTADSLGASPCDHTVFFFIGLAFLAGFSERWAQDTIVSSAPKFPAARGPEPLSNLDQETDPDNRRIGRRDS